MEQQHHTLVAYTESDRRMKCKYCRGEEPLIDGEDWIIEISERPYKGDVVLDVGFVLSEENQGNILLEINYCPMCGRKLR